jgi:hypothetical protein
MDDQRDRRPKPFLTLMVSDVGCAPPLLALCAGFEEGRWRSKELARHLFEWLLDFAFTHSELAEFDYDNAAEFMNRAAYAVYESDRYERRGEFGELLLHAVIRERFHSEAAISKVYFKDSPNDTVKGFDAVHVVLPGDGTMELWLGEAKFYGDATDAFRAAAEELEKHTRTEWLRREFMAIGNKIDPAWPHADRLRDLIHRNKSIDEIFDTIRIPLLVTYDSPVVAAASSSDDPYPHDFETEVRRLQARFAALDVPDVSVHLLLVPLKSKAELVEMLDAQLRVYMEL